MSDDIRIVETLIVREADLQERLWAIYSVAFHRLNERTPIHHGAFSREEFDRVLQDEDFSKFLVYSGSQLVGLTLLTNELGKIPWVNLSYFETRYPERAAQRKIYFLPAVVIDPEYQNLRLIGARLLQQAVTTLGEDVVLAVDYSETLRHSLPVFVQRGLGRTFKGEVLDRLVYQIFYYENPA